MRGRQLARCLEDPSFYLADFDFEREGAVFARAERRDFLASVRVSPGDFALERLSWVPFEQVYAAAPRELPERAIRYIFHQPFCGSTLLTRYLESVTHIVRDPSSLDALFLAGQVKFPRSIARLRRVSLGLLARPLDGLPVVVRTAGYHAEMIEPLVTSPTHRASVYLYSSPSVFFGQVLKSPARRRHARLLGAERRRFVQARAGERLETLTDAAVVALIWAHGVEQVIGLAARRPELALRTLDSEAFFVQRRTTLARIAEAFDLGPLQLDRVRVEDVESRHAKTGVRFDERARRRDMRRVAGVHALEIRAAERMLEKLDPAGRLVRGLAELAL